MELETILQTLTLEEKAALLQGWTTWTSREVKRLGIPSIFLSDGPHGLRKQEGTGDHLGLNASVPATCFPTAAAFRRRKCRRCSSCPGDVSDRP